VDLGVKVQKAFNWLRIWSFFEFTSALYFTFRSAGIYTLDYTKLVYGVESYKSVNDVKLTSSFSSNE
jgi:hypothetical protein